MRPPRRKPKTTRRRQIKLKKTLVIPESTAERMLTRMAYEVVERNRGAGNLSIVGIRRRGTALAERVAREIGTIEDVELPVHDLDTNPYRDDRPRPEAGEDTSRFEGDTTDRDVILVDDVLFTGRTVRAALDAIVRFGRPRSIQLVVLVDRGHREYPIRPDYVGRIIRTSRESRVIVETGAGFNVYVEG
jgi:pyrimidine operon attenuation protein / uracil phosphoribosyltransferase